jgi:hypothetical protein
MPQTPQRSRGRRRNLTMSSYEELLTRTPIAEKEASEIKLGASFSIRLLGYVLPNFYLTNFEKYVII